MKYGICYCYWSKDWEGSDYPKYIERARRCGFDVLEIFYGRTLTMPQSEVDDILAACRANDVEIYVSGGFGPEYDLASFDESVRQAGVQNSITLLKAMARIGAKNFSGINYAPWCKFDTAFEKAKATEMAAKSLREIGKACADYDFSWNMEVVNRFEGYLLNIADEAIALCDMVDSPHINILLDTFHGMIEEDDLVGMQEERKGQDLLIQAIRRLPPELLKKCLFVFVGKPCYAPILTEILAITEEYPRNVLHIEELSRQDMLSLYMQIDCLICASRDDPMPIVVTEAMLMSKSVICSEHTGSADLLKQKDAGLIC